MIIHCLIEDKSSDDTFLAAVVFISQLTKTHSRKTVNKTHDTVDKLKVLFQYWTLLRQRKIIFCMDSRKKLLKLYTNVSTQEEMDISFSCTQLTPFLSPSAV